MAGLMLSSPVLMAGFVALAVAGAIKKLRGFVRNSPLAIVFGKPAPGCVPQRPRSKNVNVENDYHPTWRIFNSAYDRYRQRPYGGPIVLYTSEEYRSRLATNDFGWAGLARAGLEIVDLPAEHFDLMKAKAVTLYGDDLRERIIAAWPTE